MTLLNAYPYEFQHGTDFSVRYLNSDQKGHAIIHRYAIVPEGGGYEVFFEMMKLLPRSLADEHHPRNWGFGTLTDPTTSKIVWKFNFFTTSFLAAQLGLLNFKGDMTTICGDDNRTYVECRKRGGGTLVATFLLAKLLPQWQKIADVQLPALPMMTSPVSETVLPTLVFEQEKLIVSQPSRVLPRRTLVALPKRVRAVVSTIPLEAIIVSPVDSDHRWFFEEVMPRML